MVQCCRKCPRIRQTDGNNTWGRWMLPTPEDRMRMRRGDTAEYVDACDFCQAQSSPVRPVTSHGR
jgi:hypothetical protein